MTDKPNIISTFLQIALQGKCLQKCTIITSSIYGNNSNFHICLQSISYCVFPFMAVKKQFYIRLHQIFYINLYLKNIEIHFHPMLSDTKYQIA